MWHLQAHSVRLNKSATSFSPLSRRYPAAGLAVAYHHYSSQRVASSGFLLFMFLPHSLQYVICERKRLGARRYYTMNSVHAEGLIASVSNHSAAAL